MIRTSLVYQTTPCSGVGGNGGTFVVSHMATVTISFFLPPLRIRLATPLLRMYYHQQKNIENPMSHSWPGFSRIFHHDRTPHMCMHVLGRAGMMTISHFECKGIYHHKLAIFPSLCYHLPSFVMRTVKESG